LTLADSFAAIFGKIFAKKKILKNSKKTYLGTFAFFISTFIFYLLLKFPELKIKFNILNFDFLDIFQFSEKNFENNKNKTIFLDIAQGAENSFFDIFLIFGKAFFVSLILTIIEFFFIFGLDNLFLPIFGAFLFSIF
jgi:dolichol kinase